VNVVATLTIDREYYDTFYTNWLSYRSRWRRHAPVAAITLAIIPMAIMLLFPGHWLIAAGFLGLALANAIDVATHRMRWLKKRMKNVSPGKTAEVVFDDDGIHISTSHSDGNMKYAAFVDATLTPNGIFLVPENELSIFMPRTAFSSTEDFDSVSTRIADAISFRAGKSG
jgi:YcxB-like protein